MSHRIKRIALCIFSALILASAAACGQSAAPASGTSAQTDAAATSAAETETTALSDGLPNTDYGGADFRVLSGQHNAYPVDTYNRTEENGDLLNDALYARNLKMAERFNIKISETLLDDIFSVNDKIKEIAYSGDDSCQMAMMIDRYALKAAIDGQLLSYDQLPNINLDQPWWNQNVRKDFSIGGKLFFCYGDDNLVFFQSTTMLAFNKQMAANYNIGDIYSQVKSGTWTTDKFFDDAAAAVSDIDGDGKFTLADQYGVVIQTNMFYPNFWLQDGYKLVEKDSDDLPYFAVPGNDGLISVMQNIYERSHADNLVYDINIQSDWRTKYDTVDSYNSVMNIFMDGHSLFVSASLTTIPVARAMETDFGIIPYPKSTEEKEGYVYGSRTFGGFPYVVPVTAAGEADMVSAVMEASACYASNYVIPVLYDQVLKTKSARDTESEEMLDMMRSNRITDLGETYWWDEIESQYEGFCSAKKEPDFVSQTAKLESKVNKLLQKNIDFFKSLGQS